MTKREIVSHVLWAGAVILWFGNNIYFGWNAEPENSIEGALDGIVVLSVVAAYFVRPTSIDKHYHTIKANTVVVRDSEVSMAEELQDRRGGK